MSIDLVFGYLDVYWAPDGEAFPTAAATPAGNWTQIGGSTGSRRFAEDGIRIKSAMQHATWHSLEGLLPEAIEPTSHEMSIMLQLANMELESVRNAFGYNAVTINAGVDHVLSLDYTSIPIRALLLRGEGKSPQVSGYNLQFEFEHVKEVGAREIVAKKDAPMMLELEFKVLAGSNYVRAGIA